MANNKFRTNIVKNRYKRSILNNIIRAIYPNVCPVCGVVLYSKHLICEECEANVSLVKNPYCEKCGKPMQDDSKLYCNDCKNRKRYFDKGISVFEYRGAIRESLHRFKYKNIRFFAEYYAREAKKQYGKTIREWNVDVIIPVPIYKKKQIQRGYNQAQVFGEELSKIMDIPLDEKLIIRVRDTKPQKGLEDTMRYINIKNAFAVDKTRLYTVNSVLLVDDIFTTGSTVDECSRLIKAVGVKHVYVLCIAAGKDLSE